jgi:carboxyl-terminal processing protease
MLVRRNFSYKTVTETSLNQLIENARKEKYYDIHKELFTQLENDVNHSLEHDLSVFKPEITELIEEEIVRRYFYEGGAIEYSLKKDEQITRAIEILNDPSRYNLVLSGKSAPEMTTSRNSLKSISDIRISGSGKMEPV